MNDLELAEKRVLVESPVHGPELLAELERLREQVVDITVKWAADDHEARILRFALSDIEVAAKAEGRPTLAHMAQMARGGTAERASNVKKLLEAVEDFLDGSVIHEEELKIALAEAYGPFRR